MQKFCFSDTNKRYHTLNYHMRQNGGVMYKAVVDCGFTCPNIDGTKSIGGCIYCDGATLFCGKGSVVEQLKQESERINKKHKNAKLIAYLQPHTNTYAPMGKLRELYYEALSFDNVCGIAIATRADCINKEITDLICEISEKYYCSVELGLQTVHDNTAKLINRGHTYEEFLTGYSMLKNAGIRVCVHIINGLPFETKDMMIQTAIQLADLNPDGVKIHSLHILKDTKIAENYLRGEFSLQSYDDYIDSVVRQLEVLPQSTVIERLTGDGDASRMLAPDWSRNKKAVLAAIDKEMARCDTYQGRLYIV